jgi:uncharacterized protein
VPSFVNKRNIFKKKKNQNEYSYWLLQGWSAANPDYARECFEKAQAYAPRDGGAERALNWYFQLQSEINLPQGGAFSAAQTRAMQTETRRIFIENEGSGAEAAAASPKSRMGINVIVYMALITFAEALSVNLLSTAYGLAFHSLILAALLLQSALAEEKEEQRVYLTMSFAPLIRLVSLTLPLQDIPMMYWYLVIGVPLFLSVFMAIRQSGFERAQIGLTANYWGLQVLFGVIGIGLGYLEYLILQPEPLTQNMTLQQLWLPAMILIVFTGFLEELIFRGLMQSAFTSALGKAAGLIYVAFIFAVLHIGYESVWDIVFVFGVALLFGLMVLFSGSIMGATIAHGLTNVFLFLIFPFIIGQPALPVQTGQFISQPTPTEVVPSALQAQPNEIADLIAPAIISTPSNAPHSITPPPAVREPDSANPAEAAVAALVVDDGDLDFFQTGEAMRESPHGLNGDFLWSYSVKGGPSTAVVWRALVKECGLYKLEVYIPDDFGTSRSVMYEISHNKGMDKVTVDQKINQGRWVDLGKYWFDSNLPGQVRTSNATGEKDGQTRVSFDAARWTYIKRCD